ncbi:exo-alpha-sialidase [Micrococcaceae bacterium RIT802]|nr:exo-alpha-sialidase [Micrococcaceae bacterium RIT 802]
MTTTAYDAITPDGTVHELTGPDADALAFAYLPAPTVQSHAANLATLPDGRLGCVWFGGTQEGVPDISVWFSTLGRTATGWDTAWSEPARLSDDPTRSEQNPILFVHGEETWLLYTAQHAGNQDTSEVRRRISYDGGASWGETHTLFPATDEGGVFVRQPPVVVDGRLLVPVFRCVIVPGEKWVGNQDDSAVMVSDDDGATWTRQVVPGSLGCVHMNIHPLANGTLLALYRSRWADWIYSSRSSDGGATWSEPVPTELPNNNSSIQFTPLDDGRLTLIYNHSQAQADTERRASLYDEIDDDGLADTQETVTEPPAPAAGAPDDGPKAFWGTPRAPLTVAVSEDGGHTWPIRRDLEVGDGYCLSNNSRDGLNREFSYPSIHQTADGQLQLAYTYFRQAIKYVRVSPEWIYAGGTD